ncbi:MAG: F0F1 ATP synthase subunit A [Bacteroidaceae bacterium]|nr:F0F1 ATP synthase subunit A [Bacteroidaceae bacterium]
MNKVRYILLLLLFLLPVTGSQAFAASGGQEPFDAPKVIFEHLKDAYEWHITTIGDKHISIPLPVIVYSERAGWQFFSSSVFHEGEEYNGFYLSRHGDNEGKVVERNAAGNEQRPLLDISITKNVLAIFLNGALLCIIMLLTSRWYRKRGDSNVVPRGFVGAMEAIVTMVIDDVIKPNVGEKWARFTPYLLTVFFFILLSNLMGLIPIFPGGANVTGNIAVTLALALCTFVAVNVFGNKEYWKEILWPDVPTWLKFPLPLMPFIELLGIFVKPFALTVRLFANIFAGHTAILVFICLIFITMSVNKYLGGAMTVISVFFTVFMNILELLVAFIQAFVFTMLSAVFIGLAQPQHHAKS